MGFSRSQRGASASAEVARSLLPRSQSHFAESATDRTGTPWNTYRHVMGVEERYTRALFHRCVGLVSVGLQPANGRDAPNHPGHDWEIGVTVLTRDAPPSYREEDLFIDGVRLVLRTVAKRPHLV